MAEFGIVKVFDRSLGRNFGFACVLDFDGEETEEEVFFHFNDRREIVRFEGNTPIFGGYKNMDYPLCATPKTGDRIVFERRIRTPEKKHDKACPWGYDNRPSAADYFNDEGVSEELCAKCGRPMIGTETQISVICTDCLAG